MRIALVFRRFALTGSLERDVVCLAEGLAREGVEVHCYCDAMRSTVEIPGVAMHDVKPLLHGTGRLTEPIERASFALRATRALRRDRGRFDLVHVIGPDAWEQDVVDVHEVVVAAQRRWPVEAGREYRLARARATAAPATRPLIALGRAVQRLQFRPGRFRRALAVTEAVRDDIVATFGVRAELVDVVPPPVDVEAFRSARGDGLRRRLGLSAEDTVLLFVGHAFERKGLADAIAALSGLPERAQLVVVGNGSAAPYAEQARSLGVAERVHFAGATQAPHEAFAESDVLVLPTLHDAWGIPLIEAMAAGIPAITTPAAGAAGVVEAAGAALVVPGREPRRLAAAVRALLEDPARRRQMGERGRSAAVRFGRAEYLAAILRTYESALAAPAPRPGRAVAPEAVGGAAP